MSLKGRFTVTGADRKYNTEAWKRYQAGNPAYKLQAKANKDKFKRDKSTSANET